MCVCVCLTEVHIPNGFCFPGECSLIQHPSSKEFRVLPWTFCVYLSPPYLVIGIVNRWTVWTYLTSLVGRAPGHTGKWGRTQGSEPRAVRCSQPSWPHGGCLCPLWQHSLLSMAWYPSGSPCQAPSEDIPNPSWEHCTFLFMWSLRSEAAGSHDFRNSHTHSSDVRHSWLGLTSVGRTGRGLAGPGRCQRPPNHQHRSMPTKNSCSSVSSSPLNLGMAIPQTPR